MFKRIICLIKENRTDEHKFRLILNIMDIPGGRAIYQCERCGFVDVDSTSMFHDAMLRKGVRTRINWCDFDKHYKK